MKIVFHVGLVCAVLLSVSCTAHYRRVESGRVTLMLRKPHARSVLLFSSLDGFQPRKAKRVVGRWQVSLPADRSFTYFYRVDGELFLPDCPMTELDDFGSRNCIFDPKM